MMTTLGGNEGFDSTIYSLYLGGPFWFARDDGWLAGSTLDGCIVLDGGVEWEE